MCPLTTQAMLDAKAMLGRAGSRVQLLGIGANPAALSLEDVMSCPQLHGMVRAWHLLTGSLPQLKRVWKAYAVEAAIERGMILHAPAPFVIDPQGEVFITQQSYSAERRSIAAAARGTPARLGGAHSPHSRRGPLSVAPNAPTSWPLHISLMTWRYRRDLSV
jgi:cytochrome oxidase Cu insertion factor (SCO1/SenC/PrrC family)